MMCPLLIKGLKEETAIKRKAANIIANMSKLVLVPADADTFLPKLLPRLEVSGRGTPSVTGRGGGRAEARVPGRARG